MNTIETEDSLGISFCNKLPLSIERGAGSFVWDEEGARYLDFTAGWGVTCLGHAHPVISAALTEQASRIIQNPNSGFVYSPVRAQLMQALLEVLPGDLKRLFFVNSGAEANDLALKLARKITGRSKVVSATGSFHGRTLNTLSVSVGEENTSRFLPRLSGCVFVPFNNTEAMKQAVDASTAAVILEPIQGEGGVQAAAPGYLATVAELCHRNGALLIVDEIQTGFCRTGKFFAIQHPEMTVEPDIFTMGKGIAGGFPFAAIAITENLHRFIENGDHGGTYSGNPLGCAVALATVKFLTDRQIARSAALQGAYLMSGLQNLAQNYPELIREVRGYGLLIALQLTDDALVARLTSVALQLGLLLTPTRNAIVRLLPALVLERSEADLGLSLLEQALNRIRPRVAAAS